MRPLQQLEEMMRLNRQRNRYPIGRIKFFPCIQSETEIQLNVLESRDNHRLCLSCSSSV